MTKTTKNTTIKIAVTAMYTALIIAGKNVLALVPNVEVVTLLTALLAFTWGLGYALPSTVVFVLEQALQYGFNTWVISYAIHWPFVAVAFWLLGKLPLNKPWKKIVFPTVLATLLTALFGVVTSIVDAFIGYSSAYGFMVQPSFSEALARFTAIYVSGAVFYVTHVASNLVFFMTAFYPLERINAKAKLRLLDA